MTVNGEEITCTPNHPFYSPVKGWTSACKLRAGDVLVTLNGEYVVVEQVQHELLECPEATYNFEVEDFHTYYVGDTPLLVHNDCLTQGGGHAKEPHRSDIEQTIKWFESMDNVIEIYGNRSLKTAGLNGTQQPDIIVKTNDGNIYVYEFASPSQVSGTGKKMLDAKIELMQKNNKGVIFILT